MTATTTRAIPAIPHVLTTPSPKNTNTAASERMRSRMTVDIFMSRSVRSVSTALADFPANISLKPTVKACTMIFDDLRMPMTPAAAMPPMPMWRT